MRDPNSISVGYNIHPLRHLKSNCDVLTNQPNKCSVKTVDAGGNTGPASSCASGWATNGKCQQRPTECASAKWTPDSVDGLGCLGSSDSINHCPSYACGDAASHSTGEDSLWAGEGTKCTDGGVTCDATVGYTCHDEVWYKNCPSGKSCEKAATGEKCWQSCLNVKDESKCFEYIGQDCNKYKNAGDCNTGGCIWDRGQCYADGVVLTCRTCPLGLGSKNAGSWMWLAPNDEGFGGSDSVCNGPNSGQCL